MTADKQSSAAAAATPSLVAYRTDSAPLLVLVSNFELEPADHDETLGVAGKLANESRRRCPRRAGCDPDGGNDPPACRGGVDSSSECPLIAVDRSPESDGTSLRSGGA